VDIPVNVRVIAATNKDILGSVADKTFREDLYYRLKVFQITIPPLRARKDDVPVLIDHFIELFNLQFGKKVRRVESEAKQILMQYNWPGNVRELRNVMERAIILETNSTLCVKDLPGEIRNIQPTPVVVNNTYNFELPEEGISLKELEKQVILQALQKANNNQTKASKLLGISRDTLRYKQKKYQL